jgi:mono/diheme cytochrome c family protein
MRTNQVKLFAIIFFALPLLLLTIFRVAPVTAAAFAEDDAATSYTKLQCVVCHTKTATKFFTPDKPDADLVEAILTGRPKTEKRPIAMKAFAVTQDQAKALVDYMRSIRPPAN